MKTKPKTRYKSLKHYTGIRKDLFTGKYEAYKRVKGKRYSKQFENINQAVHWRNTFSPKLTIESLQGNLPVFTPKNAGEVITLGKVLDQYKIEHIATLEKSSQENRLQVMRFLDGLIHVTIDEITPQLLTQYLILKKEECLKTGDGRRYSFNNELKVVRALFNWYKDFIDHTFSNPVLKRHFKIGRIKVSPKKEKKLSAEELRLFFEALSEKPFWLDFAIAQFFLAARSQEVAGIQLKSVDFKSATVTIKDVAVWGGNSKKFSYLKPVPKNGELRACYLNQTLVQIFNRRFHAKASNCNYVFHIEGRPLHYREIQHHYNWALKKCGLYGRFSGTHIMRHSMATITREVTGNLDSVQAVTGHRDQRLAQHYAALSSDVQKDAVLSVEEYLKTHNEGVQRCAEEAETKNLRIISKR